MLQNVRYALVDGIAPGALRVSKEGILLFSPVLYLPIHDLTLYTILKYSNLSGQTHFEFLSVRSWIKKLSHHVQLITEDLVEMWLLNV